MELARRIAVFVSWARRLTSPRWRMRLGVMAIVVLIHWIAFGTLPATTNRFHKSHVLPTANSSSITLHILSTSWLKVADSPATPKAKEQVKSMRVAPTQPAKKPLATPPKSEPQAPSIDESLGVAGMLDDESPIILIPPQPTQLHYAGRGSINGQSVTFEAELQWRHDGTTYETSLDIGDLEGGPHTLTSQGSLTDRGVEPMRFVDKAMGDSAATFDQVARKVRFSNPPSDADLTLGAQDQLSVYAQLAAIFQGNADRLPAGSTVTFQTIGARSAELWTFTVVNFELFYYPTGPINTVHLSLFTGANQNTTHDVWLAPETGYLPLRIRIADNNGNFVEQEWQPVDKP